MHFGNVSLPDRFGASGRDSGEAGAPQHHPAGSHQPQGPATGDCRHRGPPATEAARQGGGVPERSGRQGGALAKASSDPQTTPGGERRGTRGVPCPEGEGPGRREGPGRQRPPPPPHPGHNLRERGTGGKDPRRGEGLGVRGQGRRPPEVAPLPSPGPTETHRDAAALTAAGPSAAPSAARPARDHPARSRDGPAPAGRRSPRGGGRWPRGLPGVVVLEGGADG